MFAIVDTETTGGNPARDRIMEIAIIVHDGEKVVAEFNSLVNPETPISPFIISLTGISDKMVAQAPKFEEIAEQVLRLTDKNIFVAHNARFDYAVLRREFRRMGIRFQRKQLCTVNLSRKLLPDKKSYSLGNLCKEIGIQVNGRHRAFGDAQATTQLFDMLLINDKEEIINSVFVDELEKAELPPNLSKETVDDLPEETGIYYFLDDNMKVIYVGKSKNIRKRVIDQLTKDLADDRFVLFRNKISDLSYEITGSELIAQLSEINEIRKHSPQFNFAKRKKQYNYGIYHYYDEKGFINLTVERLSDENKSLVQAASHSSAVSILQKLVMKYQLHPSLCGMKATNELTISPQFYNAKVGSFLRKHQFRYPNFFIIGEGRSHHEQSVIWIENHIYRGFGYFEPEEIENDIASIKDCVQRFPDSPEADRAIRNWLRKKNKDEIIRY